MKLLAIDSFSSVLSAALLNGDTTHYAQAGTEMKHSELLIDLLDSLCREAEIKPADIDGVLCMEGPGSFTGLRIGYSSAKGLALSLSIPFAAIPTFDCIAHGFKDGSLILTLADARKNAWFYAFFRGEKRLSTDGDGDYSMIADGINNFLNKHANEKIILTGSGASSFFESIPNGQRENYILNREKGGYARELIFIAQEREIFKNDNSGFLFSGPQYLRKSDAELNS